MKYNIIHGTRVVTYLLSKSRRSRQISVRHKKKKTKKKHIPVYELSSSRDVRRVFDYLSSRLNVS